MSGMVPAYAAFCLGRIPFCWQTAKVAGGFSGFSSKDRSVRRHRRIHFVAPGFDTPPHALGLFEPLLPQPVGDPEATDAVMAVNDDPLRPPSLDLIEPLRQFLHWNQAGSSNFGRGVFLRCPAVEQETVGRFGQQSRCLTRFDFGWEAHCGGFQGNHRRIRAQLLAGDSV